MMQDVERFVFLNPIGMLEGVVIFLLFLVVLYGTLKDVRRLGSLSKKLILISLRSASFLLIVFILLNPAIRIETYEETKPLLAVLVDNSWSMRLAGDKSGTSRIQAVRDFFANHEDFFSKIEEKFLTSYYTFDESLKPASLDSINADEPNGKNTDIGKTIRELEKQHDSDELASVILLSDGGDHGSVLEDDFLKNLEFPVNTVATSADSVRDMWIEGVKVSEVAFLRYPLSVDVEIKSGGFDDLSIPVTLKEGDKIISTQEIPIGSLGNHKAEFVLRPKSVGRKVYNVSIPVLSDEVIKENNQKSFVIDVIIDKIRVLHVAGNPSWDVRFLRKVLERNPNVDLVSFFILRDASDSVFASQNELSLIPFPVDEIFDKELETFDVVIFHNFYSRPYGIYDYHLKNLRDYVVEDGGAFFMIGGMNSFDSGSYGRTPISEILPVELDPIPRMFGETFSRESFQAGLTSIGASHPVMRIVPNVQDNEKYWGEMPELDGFNRVEGLKPDTLPLLVTPEGEPLLVLNKVQSGKVASFLSDSSWKWSFARAGEGEIIPYYEKFWDRLLLWSVNDPELKDVRVRTDRTSYSIGERVKVDAKVINYEDQKESKSSETDGTAVNFGEIGSSVILPSGVQKELKFEKEDLDDFASEIETDEYGAYRVNIALRKNPDLTTEGDGDETVFLVEPPDEEIKGSNINQGLLEIIAQQTGGRAITVKDSPEKLGIDFSPKRTITGYRTVEIWNNLWFFMIILTLLSLEWMLGRRWGLR